MILFHSLSSSCVWCASSLSTTTGPPRSAMRFSKSSTAEVCAGGFGPRTAVISSGSSFPPFLALVELLHVRQIKRAERACPLAFAAHVALEVAPEDFHFRRHDRIGAENATAFEIRPQALEHDHVRRDQEKRFGKVVARLRHRVEELPGNGQRHDLGLAAAGRHLHGVAGEVVVLQQAQIATRGEGLDQALVPPHLGDLVEIDQRLDRFALEIVIGELAAVRQPMIGVEPVVQQDARGVADALVAVRRATSLTFSRMPGTQRRGGNARFQQAKLIARRLLASRGPSLLHFHFDGLGRVVAENVDDLDDDRVFAGSLRRCASISNWSDLSLRVR